MPAPFSTTIGRRERRRRKRRQWVLEMADQNDAEQWIALQAAKALARAQGKESLVECMFWDLESNFYAHAFEHDGIVLPTSEHHLMRAKALLMGDAATTRKIEQAKTPMQAKRLGRSVRPFRWALWEEHSAEIMEDILVSKFSSSHRMKDYLLGIQGHFYEASAKDKIWGIGISVANAEAGVEHNGQNRLGKALDRARARIAAA